MAIPALSRHSLQKHEKQTKKPPKTTPAFEIYKGVHCGVRAGSEPLCELGSCEQEGSEGSSPGFPASKGRGFAAGLLHAWMCLLVSCPSDEQVWVGSWMNKGLTL